MKAPDQTLLQAMELMQNAGMLIASKAANYGDATASFQRIAALWTAVLGHHVTPRQVALCMAALKISREVSAHQEDNMIDGAAYLALASALEGAR